MSCLGSHEHRFDPSPPPPPPLPGSGLNPDFPGLSPDQAAEKGPRPLPAGQPYRLVAMARSGLGIHTPCAAYMFISEFGKLTATRVRIRTHALSPLACGSMVDRLGTPDALGNQSPQNVNHFATALGVPGQGSPLPASVGDSGSIPGSGRSPGGGHDNPLQHFTLENPVNREAWWAMVQRLTESDTTEAT